MCDNLYENVSPHRYGSETLSLTFFPLSLYLFLSLCLFAYVSSVSLPTYFKINLQRNPIFKRKGFVIILY